MANPAGLTLAFLRQRPLAAARVIEEIDAADGAAFLETVPVRIGAPVVAGMAPWSAARCVERLGDEQAAGLIRAMSYQDGTTILRLMAKTRVGEVLQQMPKRLAHSFEASLTYPKGSVGAWMDPGVLTFAAERKVADALKSIQTSGSRNLSHIFVEDDERRFAGVVSIGDLLCSAPQTPLAEITDRSVQPLSNRATLASVADRVQWESYITLPVVGRRNQILGGLTQANLRKGLEEDITLTPVINPDSIIGHLLTSYTVVWSGLLRLVLRPDPERP